MFFKSQLIFLFIVSLTSRSFATEMSPLRSVRDIMKPDGFFGSKPISYYDEKVGIIAGYNVYLEKTIYKKILGFNYISKTLETGGFVTLDAKLRGVNKKGKLLLKNGYIENGSLLVGRAVLDGNGRLINSSVARDNSKILGDAVLDSSSLSDSATVSGNAIVKGSTIYENATISGNAKVSGSDVYGTSTVKDWAIISENSDICGDSIIGNFTRVRNSDDICNKEQFEFDDSFEEESSVEDDESRVENMRELFEECIQLVRQKSESQL
ncbi:MAG: hypothetical protein AB8G05_00670 [Oligoflexales bacterium]